MFPSVVPLHRTASYALLTRPPLIEGASSFSPFDLHVLGTPPAFVLSQDQTLRLILDRNSSSFTGSAFFKLVSSLFCPYSSVMVPAGAVSVTRVWRATGDILLSLERFVNPFFAVFLSFFTYFFNMLFQSSDNKKESFRSPFKRTERKFYPRKMKNTAPIIQSAA